MAHSINEIAARLARIEDREAIRELIASYGPLADCGDGAGVARLWQADGRYEVAGFAGATGHGEIAALIEGPHHQALMAQGCAHLLGPVTIEVDGDGATARGHSVVFAHDDGGFIACRVSANRWVLARGAQGWRVVHRANALLDGGASARLLLAPAMAQPAN